MTVFVALELVKGRVESIKAYLRPESAERARQRWLKEHGIKNNIGGESKTEDGREFIVLECELKP